MPNPEILDPEAVVLAPAHNAAVEAAQRWLLTGLGEMPDLSPLAHTVNAYDRIEDWDKAQRWLEARIEILGRAGAESFQNQELLDFLFLMVRKERYCEG